MSHPDLDTTPPRENTQGGHPCQGQFIIARIRSIHDTWFTACHSAYRPPVTRALKDATVTTNPTNDQEASQARAAATSAFVPVSSVG